MANQESVISITIPAGGDLSASQYRFVQVASDGQCDIVAGAGLDATGVLQNAPDAAGKASEIAIAGRVKVVAGGTVASGALVQSDASGDALLATTGDFVLGQCLIGGAVGEVIEVLLNVSHNISL